MRGFDRRVGARLLRRCVKTDMYDYFNYFVLIIMLMY